MGSPDEEKLKETVFAEAGKLTVRPQGDRRIVEYLTKREKYKFYSQEMKMEWSVELTTPFSTVKRTLAGSTQFPVVWPKDVAAKNLTRRIASESFKMLGVGSEGLANKKP